MRLHSLALPLAPALLLLLGLAPERPQDAKLDLSAKSCGECHTEIHAEWKESAHARSWIDPIYQAHIKEKTKPEACHDCHIPQSVLPVAPKRVKPRQELLDDGVSCASCHVHEGKVHGPYGAKTDAHPSVKSDLFTGNSVDLCQTCHRVAPKPVISLGLDFENAKLADQGKSCKGCHMPEVERHLSVDPKTGKPAGDKRQGRVHRFLGPDHKEMAAKAFELKSEEKNGKLVLSLANLAGHRLPGLTLRSYDVTFEVLDAAGKVLASKEGKIDEKNPLRELTSLIVEIDKPAGAAKSKVSVHYKFSPEKGKVEDRGVVFTAEK
jgi:hypothetical protein